MDEIVPGLFVGDWNDAQRPFEGFVFNVLENPPPFGMYRGPWGWVPILRLVEGEMRAIPELLDVAADNIDSALRSHGKVLVHCGAGIERSPLTVAWFLWKKRGMEFEQAYELVTKRRPQAQRRDGWILWPREMQG